MTVFVKDMQRSIGLFNGLLGMEIIQRLPVVKGARISKLLGITDFEAEMVFLKHPEQNVCLELVHRMASSENSQNQSPSGGFCLALTAPDLDGLHAELSEAGWPPVSEPLEMLDPEGRPIRLFCIHTDEGLMIELIEQTQPK